MNGEHILRHQAKGIRTRVDSLLAIYSYACLGFMLVAVTLSLALVFFGALSTAITLFVLSTALTGYAYSTLLLRQQHIKDITDKTIDALRSRWDELRKDPDLLKFFSSIDNEEKFDSVQRLKVRLYVSTVIDMYAVIIHYINHGYFLHVERFAAIYEEMIRTLFRYPRMSEVWRSNNVWGNGCLKNEYGVTITDVIEEIIKEIEAEKTREEQL